MCLSIAILRPETVLSRGEFLGYEFMVVHNQMGYRCGYVKVEPGHPWHGKSYEYIDANVHGGLTFSQADEPCPKGGRDDGWWLGFDCAHSCDRQDPSLPHDFEMPIFDPHGAIRTTEYVEDQCRSLCKQAYDAFFKNAIEKSKPQTP